MEKIVQEIINKADKLEKEYEKVSLYGCESLINEWPEERQTHFSMGPILGMFIDGEPQFKEYLFDSSKIIEVDNLKRNIIWLMEDCDKERRNFIKEIFQGKELEKVLSKVLYASSAERYKSVLCKAESLEEVDAIVRDYNGELIRLLENEDTNVRLKYLFCYIEYRKFLLRKKNEQMFSSIQEEIDDLYSNYFEKNSEYRKYGLIPCDSTRELIVANPPRLYDKNINKTIILKLPEGIVRIIERLIRDGYIGNASFRASDTILDGKNENQYICEAVERGQIFDSNYESLSNITKLYSSNDNIINYDNQLWIVKEGLELYFEELDSDYEVYRDSIVTRLIHIQVIKEGEQGIYKISHMDYEYIFYTVDEFEERKQSAGTKGESMKRKKMFKIDDCTIPFDYKVKVMRQDYSETEVLLLQYVLNMFFKHKDLLDEYFSAFIA